MIVYTATETWGLYEPSVDLGIFASEKGAKDACDAEYGEPLDWSDPTLDGVFDRSPDVWNAEGGGAVYTVHREAVKP